MDHTAITELTETVFDNTVTKINDVHERMLIELNDAMQKFINEKMAYTTGVWEYPKRITKEDMIYHTDTRSGDYVGFDDNYPASEKTSHMLPFKNPDEVYAKLASEEVILVIIDISLHYNSRRLESCSLVYTLNAYGSGNADTCHKIPGFLLEFIIELLSKCWVIRIGSRTLIRANYSNGGGSGNESHINRVNPIINFIFNGKFIQQFLKFVIDVPQHPKYFQMHLANERLISENNNFINRMKSMETTWGKFEQWKESVKTTKELLADLQISDNNLKKKIIAFNLRKHDLEIKERQIAEKQKIIDKLSEIDD